MCMEDSPSGLWRTLGKRVGCKPSGVRIPHPPQVFSPGTAYRCGSGAFLRQHPVSTSRALWAAARDSLEPRGFLLWARLDGARGAPLRREPFPGVERALRGACTLEPGPPRDGIIRTSPGQECSKDKGALPGARRILVFPDGHSTPLPVPFGVLPEIPASSRVLPSPAPPARVRQWRSFQRLCCRVPRAKARPPDGPGPQCSRARRAQAPKPSMTSAAGSAASSSPGTKSFEARRPDPMQLHPLAQLESMRRRH